MVLHSPTLRVVIKAIAYLYPSLGWCVTELKEKDENIKNVL